MLLNIFLDSTWFSNGVEPSKANQGHPQSKVNCELNKNWMQKNTKVSIKIGCRKIRRRLNQNFMPKNTKEAKKTFFLREEPLLPRVGKFNRCLPYLFWISTLLFGQDNLCLTGIHLPDLFLDFNPSLWSGQSL